MSDRKLKSLPPDPFPSRRFGDSSDPKLAAYHLDFTEEELSATSDGSDIDWGDRGREIERHDDDRVKASREFQEGKLRFLISNQQTGAFGNTWTAAQTVVYFSNNYQLELRRQSEDRAHRIGLTHSVNYVDLIARNTVDEKIVKALRSYSQIASATLGENWKEWI